MLKTQLPRITAPVTLHIAEGSDHSFKVPKSIGKSEREVWQEISSTIITDPIERQDLHCSVSDSA